MMQSYTMFSRNMLEPKTQMDLKYNRVYKTQYAIVGVLSQLPESKHDIRTFNVDVLKHDNQTLILVIDGIYKEMPCDSNKENYLQFRRTFIFNIRNVDTMSHYSIAYEMFSVSFASPEKIKNSFQTPIRHLNQLSLIDPEKEDKDIIRGAFTHITQLKNSEAESRLQRHSWDLRKALSEFAYEYKNDFFNDECFMKSDLSDLSSVLDVDEID
ncbi:unnamed protein product [Danaus chrysippus]|nr:unnamed protein product [Danaus chrysippus]